MSRNVFHFRKKRDKLKQNLKQKDGMKMGYNAETVLRLSKPGNSINNALPLGNGTLGALVCGGVCKDRLFLNHDELWTGYPRETATEDKSEVFRTMREMAYAGKLCEVNDLVEAEFNERNVQCYLPLGTLTFETSHGKVTGYRRELDLSTGTARVTFKDGGAVCRREYFVSFPHKVIAVRYARGGRRFDFTAGFSTELKAEITADGTDILCDGICPSDSYTNTDSFVYSEKDEEKGISFRCAVRVLTDGSVNALRRKIRVTGAKEVVVLCSCETSFNGPFKHPFLEGKEYRCAALKTLDNAEKATFDALLERHIADHSALWDQMAFTLHAGNTDLSTDRRLLLHDKGGKDPGLYVLLFNFQRYLSIAASRPGSRCMNLQGIWNTEMRAPWSSNYTVNINTEMNYWPQAQSDLLETTEPFISLVDTLRLRGAKTAKLWYGAGGATCHHNTDIWGQTTPVRGRAVWLYWPCALGWMSSQAWEIFQYSGDLDALRSKIFPAMAEAARFFLDVLTPDAEGYLIFAPSTSPENCFRKDGRAVAVSLTTAMTMEIIARLFADLKDAGNVLRGAGDTVDEVLLRKAAEAQEKLLPIRLTDDGRIYEWYENPPEEEPHHRHVSPLYALFPAHLIDKDEMPDLAEACKEFLTHRGDAGTGWSLGWKINLWAVLGDGDHALRLLDMQLSPRGMRGAPKDGGGTYPNLFDAHPPFQIDGNFGAGAGILNLLVREANGKITLLPALPAEWKNGSVRGLRLKGGKKADFSWRNGKLTESRIYDAP